MGRAKRKPKVEQTLGPTPERMAKGRFKPVLVELEGHQDRRTYAQKDMHAMPVDEWLSRGIITEQQHRACDYYAELHQASGLFPRVTAAYEGRLTTRTAAFGPGNTMRQCEAISELREWAKKIPAKYLDVFTDVVIYGRKTGEAGADLGYRSTKAEVAAMTCVRFVADLIATEKRF